MKQVRRPGMQIAIDGPAASGKSTLGTAIAKTLGLNFLDTGQMYRAVTQAALATGVPANDEVRLNKIAQNISFELTDRGLLVDGSLVGPDLHSLEIDSAVSEVSAHPAVRAVLVDRQREMAGRGPLVMVGRDIGTVVLPEAPVKLWLTASGAERARRRLHDQPVRSGHDGHEEALARLDSRDRYDTTRAHSPLQQAPDAIFVNTDGQSSQQVLDQALSAIRAACGDGPL